MAACGSLQHIFEKPLPENPTLLESLSSWKPIEPVENSSSSSFTEIFGELHFEENHHHLHHNNPDPSISPLSSLPSPSSFAELCPSAPARLENDDCEKNNGSNSDSKRKYRHSDSFSSVNSESLSLCTEGLGFESSGDVDDLKNDANLFDWKSPEEMTRSLGKRAIAIHGNSYGELRRSRSTGAGGAFPPPISCIGSCGKPWVSFKSYRHDGRFILKEVKMPTQEFLQAHREDGRLKLHFVQSDDEFLFLEGEENVEEEDQVQVLEKNDDEEEEENHCMENDDIEKKEEKTNSR